MPGVLRRSAERSNYYGRAQPYANSSAKLKDICLKWGLFNETVACSAFVAECTMGYYLSGDIQASKVKPEKLS